MSTCPGSRRGSRSTSTAQRARSPSTSSPAATPTSPTGSPTPTAPSFVLRRPPLGHVLATAHDMGREHKIISALGPTDVPVAPALGLCTDDEVERRALLRHGVRRRARAPRRGRRHVDHRRRSPEREPLHRRHDGEDPRGRPRRRRPRRPRQEGGLHPAAAQALVRPVGEARRPASSRWSTRSTTRCSPRCPSRARPRSCTATTGSTTA